MQNKVVIKGKVKKESNRKFRIEKDEKNEIDVDIDIQEDGDYEVEKLSIEGLPARMDDGNPIRWFNNFAIKKNGQYIKQRYTVKIAGISRIAPSRLVILDSNGQPYYYTGPIVNDTFEMTDGDPATGGSP